MAASINYNNKKFRALHNSGNGEVDTALVFHYRQQGNILSCAYSGANIVQGHLLGLVADDGTITMRYHQVNTRGQLMTGTCISTPEIMENGKIKLYEDWQWTSGDLSAGNSVLIEID
ncbi:hypothetical protein ACFS6H_15990 [Terrimonas rubra]|uniref:N-acetylglutamate synthase n=1 Tax=Terrimonas rubra TaxID=1035890 RepID=A0ABW6AB91_9BACT